MKLTPLLAFPPTVTTTLPVVAPAGTGATMLVALQLVGVATVPLNVTVLVPCVAPKFVPVTVTEVPTAPELGLRLAILGEVDVLVDVPALAHPKKQNVKAADSSNHRSESRRRLIQLHSPRGPVLGPRFVNWQPIER